MRLGVSAKIFLAYTVLLGAFAATSVFSLVYLYEAGRENEAIRHRRDVQRMIEVAERGFAMLDSEVASKTAKPTIRLEAKGLLDEALAAIDRANRPADFASYRVQVVKLQGDFQRFLKGEHQLAPLIASASRLRKELERDNTRAADEMKDRWQQALNMAVGLGALGLVVAVGAALLMWRTLRPLGILRAHARQIAGGDYARRTQVRSRDEIGDLAREFDAMARALEEREQRLVRSERLATVGRMAAQITHEIRNPLASIGLNVELMADELGPELAEARRLVAAIGNEVDRLSEITETYLRFVRLPRPELEREDLGALVTGVLEFARAELGQAGITLDLIVAPGLPEVAADENQIRQAILNLVRNAKEAMPSGGTLRVEVAAAGGHVRVCVADTGPGIAPEHLGKIFEPFFSTKEKGTGLGLALVQQIVAEHGGRVEVASPPSGGTAFTLALPAAPEGRAVSAAVVEPAPAAALAAAPAAAKAH